MTDSITLLGAVALDGNVLPCAAFAFSVRDSTDRNRDLDCLSCADLGLDLRDSRRLVAEDNRGGVEAVILAHACRGVVAYLLRMPVVTPAPLLDLYSLLALRDPAAAQKQQHGR